MDIVGIVFNVQRRRNKLWLSSTPHFVGVFKSFFQATWMLAFSFNGCWDTTYLEYDSGRGMASNKMNMDWKREKGAEKA